jgi:hypothetical protein
MRSLIGVIFMTLNFYKTVFFLAIPCMCNGCVYMLYDGRSRELRNESPFQYLYCSNSSSLLRPVQIASEGNDEEKSSGAPSELPDSVRPLDSLSDKGPFIQRCNEHMIPVGSKIVFDKVFISQERILSCIPVKSKYYVWFSVKDNDSIPSAPCPLAGQSWIERKV